jgi:hypothetical protein
VNAVNGDSIGDAIPKHTSRPQAAGEVRYAGDADQLRVTGVHAALVTSPVVNLP